MSIIQRPYIIILNALYALVGRMSEQARNVALTATCIAIAAFFPITDSWYIILDEGKRMVVLGALIALIGLFGMKDRVRPVKWNVPFVVSVYGFAIWMLIARTQHGLKRGTVLFILFLLVVVPCVSLVWSNRGDFSTLYDRIALSVVVAGIAFYVASLIVFPYAADSVFQGRYTGLTWNSNNLGMLTALTIAASAYLMIRNRQRFLAAVSGGLALAMLYLSVSRTALLSSGAVLILFLICVIRERIQQRRVLWRDAAAIAVILVCAVVGTWVMRLPTEHFDYRGIESVKEQTDSRQKYTRKELEELGVIPATATASLAPVLPVIPAEQKRVPSAWERRFQNTGDMNRLSSGRLAYYRFVLDRLNPLGHDAVAEPFLNKENTYVHNTILEFTYYGGVPAGLAFLLIEVLTLVYVLWAAFGRRRIEPGAYFGMLIGAVFLIMSLTEVATILSSRSVAFFFYQIFPLLFASRKALWYNEQTEKVL